MITGVWKMVDLLDGYVGSSCVIKAKNNDLISMGGYCIV